MSRKGDCWENAGAESFFSILVWSNVCFENGFPDPPPCATRLSILAHRLSYPLGCNQVKLGLRLSEGFQCSGTLSSSVLRV